MTQLAHVLEIGAKIKAGPIGCSTCNDRMLAVADLAWISEDGRLALFHGDGLAVADALPRASVDLVLTDPPYSQRAIRGTRSSMRSYDPRTEKKHDKSVARIHYASASDAFVAAMLEEAARISRAWTVAFMDSRHAAILELEAPPGALHYRTGLWVKTNAAPQFNGMGPAECMERVGILHRDGQRRGRRADGTLMRWNDGGAKALWIYPTDREHPDFPGGAGVKPVPLLREQIRQFSDRDDLIFDFCAGSGSTLEAAYLEGRRAIAVELDEVHAAYIVERMRRVTAQRTLFAGAAT